MLTRKRARAMDPLHVTMTGVRMGERFLQIGCYDRALLAGLAAKVGLSGTAAVAAFDDAEGEARRRRGRKIGALIETHKIEGRALPFDSDQFDMVVVDDTTAASPRLPMTARARVSAGSQARRAAGRPHRDRRRHRRARGRGYDALRDLTNGGVQAGATARRARRFSLLEGPATVRLRRGLRPR